MKNFYLCKMCIFPLICDSVLARVDHLAWRFCLVGWMRKDLSCESRFGLWNSTVRLWDPWEIFTCSWAQVSHGPIRDVRAVRRSGHRVCIRGGSELSTGGLPQGNSWVFTFLRRAFSQQTIGIIKSNFSGFFLVHDTEGRHQIFPDHSEAGDGGEAERH